MAKTAVKKKKGLNAATGILLSFIILLVIAAAAVGVVAARVGNQEGIYEGVTVSGINVGGLSRREAEQKLERQIGAISEGKNFNVVIGDRSYNLTARDFNIRYDATAAAAKAYFYGRDGGKMDNLKKILAASSGGYDIPFTVSFDTDNIAELADRIAHEVEQTGGESRYEVRDDCVFITVGGNSVSVDPRVIEAAIIDRFNGVTTGDVVIEPNTVEHSDIDLEAICEEISVEPVDAYIDESDPENPVLVPEIVGRTFDIEEARKILNGEGEGPGRNIYRINFTELIPEITRENLKLYTYDDLLSSVTTNLNPGNVSRTDNIRLACSKINGLILYPGDEFSFNKIVGERTYAAGFKDATIYLAGELADGVGGGICQVSSTIYDAAVYADLKITERHNHRYTVSYVKNGLDATVAYDSGTDFRFKNDTEYAIKINVVQESNYVKCDFYGTLTDENRNKTVSMVTVEKDKTDYDVVYKIDETVPQGTRTKKNGGYTGHTVETYRVTKIDGVEVSRVLENKSKYSKLDELYLINPLDAKVAEDGTITYEPGVNIPPTPQDPVVPEEPDTPNDPYVPDYPPVIPGPGPDEDESGDGSGDNGGSGETPWWEQ